MIHHFNTVTDEIPVVLQCDESFRTQARYAFTMLGLIAGFRPRFVSVPESRRIAQSEEPHIHYGPAAPREERATFVPASPRAHAFLLRKGAFTIAEAADMRWEGLRCLSLFPCGNAGVSDAGTHPVPDTDIVSAAFFFLSLHEEWSSPERDEFGRFPCEHSLLHRLGLLDRPVVAEYARILAHLMALRGITPASAPRYGAAHTAICMTHDIDHLTKLTRGFFYDETWKKLLRNDDHQPLSRRLRRYGEYWTFLADARNPHLASLRQLLAMEREHAVRATYFVKTGGRDKRDSGYDPRNRHLAAFLEEAARDGHEVGLHPSFRSWNDREMMADELARLTRILPPGSNEGIDRRGAGCADGVASVRQHYLRLDTPRTWRLQTALGLEIDASLGFAGHEGFRNGTCHPFLVFDLDACRALPLWEFPLHAMDGTFTSYRNIGAPEAAELLDALFGIVRGHGGVWTVLFHNVIADTHEFPGWDAVCRGEMARTADRGIHASTVSRVLDAWLHSCGYRSRDEVKVKIS